MREFSIYIVSAINVVILVIYCWQLITKQTKPALAMWVFFSIAVAMSLVTYLKAGDFSLLDNILNTTDLVLVISVSIAIAVFGDNSTRFNKFDLGCFGAVSLIVIFWLITQNHWVTNLLIQLILIIAYFPVIRRMLSASKNTEPFSVWILLMVVPLFSLLSSKGLLASIYAFRAIACTTLLLVLMLRIELVNKKKAKLSTKTKS